MDRAVNGVPADAEQRGQLSGGVDAPSVELDKMLGLHSAELGLLPAQPAFRLRHLHPLASAHADQVCLELGHHRQNAEQQPPHRVGRIMDRPAEAESHVAPREFVEDVPGVRQ